MAIPTVYMAMPYYGNVVADAANAFFAGGFVRNAMKVHRGWEKCSLLTTCFNRLWVKALNLQVRGHAVDYFLMLHSDCVPLSMDYGDILLEELRRTNADIVSVVVPMKVEGSDLTSTALGIKGDPFHTNKVFKIEDLDRGRNNLTFDVESDLKKERLINPEIVLLVNTGCWLCRFDRPWRKHKKVLAPNELELCFEQKDRIVELPSGEFEAQSASEDWNFSRTLAKLGCKVCATTKVKIEHEGTKRWSNVRS